jgi:hypothetical protein
MRRKLRSARRMKPKNRKRRKRRKKLSRKLPMMNTTSLMNLVKSSITGTKRLKKFITKPLTDLL